MKSTNLINNIDKLKSEYLSSQTLEVNSAGIVFKLRNDTDY